MLRYTVEAGERPAALLSEEIAFVEDYLGVARERYENPLSFEYRGPGELLSVAVPPLLLQPLVENSLKHGCAPAIEPLHSRSRPKRRTAGSRWYSATTAIVAGTANRGLGVGLENLEQRVRRFGGPDASMVAGARAGGGFAVAHAVAHQAEAAA